MINKLKKEKKMKKVRAVREENNTGAFIKTAGGLLIGLGILDFALSWSGTNITGFLGPISRFTPMIFGFVGVAMLNAGNKEED